MVPHGTYLFVCHYSARTLLARLGALSLSESHVGPMMPSEGKVKVNPESRVPALRKECVGVSAAYRPVASHSLAPVPC